MRAEGASQDKKNTKRNQSRGKHTVNASSRGAQLENCQVCGINNRALSTYVRNKGMSTIRQNDYIDRIK